MSEFVAVRLGMQCPDCMGPLPLNRIDPKALCHHCLSTLDLDWPTNLFARGWVASPRTWAIGKRDFCANVSLPFKMDVERVGGVPAASSERPADALVTRVFPDARHVHNEASGGDPGAPVEALVCACLSCGAGLKVDGTSRVVACKYCNDTSFLPDALWLRLHPALKRRWFVIEY
jgi:hypothetical protein